MALSQEQLVAQLVNEVASLRQQVAELKAERRPRRAWKPLLKRLGLVLGGVIVVGTGSFAFANTGACPNSYSLPVCFSPNTPALAADMNKDLTQIQDWIEAKVGSVSTPNLTVAGTATHKNQVIIQTANTSIAPIVGSKPLVVTGNITNGTNDQSNGIEFRHDNLSQGIGFGFNGIYATGSNQDQDLNLSPRGAGWVKALGTLWVRDAIETPGELRGGTIRQRSCSWGPRGPSVLQDSGYHSIFCPAGQYMAGWQCVANGYLDGDCAAWCCYP